MSEGSDKAKKYLQANEKAIKNIEQIVKQEQIECELEKQNAYVFTNKKSEIAKIQKEVEAVKTLGMEAEFVTKTDLPFKMLGAIKFSNQAQFNPLKYANRISRKHKK